MEPAWKKYLSDECVRGLAGLQLRCPTLLHGLYDGSHRSSHVGHAMEFMQFRQYAPGDDVRYIDWKAYARTDKYYLRQSEIERNLTTQIVLDHSASMAFGDPTSKLDYAKCLSMALAFLAVTHRDPVGVATVTDRLNGCLEPSAYPEQLGRLGHVFDTLRTSGKTDITFSIQSLIGMLKHPSLIVLVSDFLDSEDRIASGLAHIRGAGHEALVLHVMDRDEHDFPLRSSVRFSDLEQHDNVDLDANSIAQSYRNEIRAFIDRMRRCAHRFGFNYRCLITDEPPQEHLTALFSR